MRQFLITLFVGVFFAVTGSIVITSVGYSVTSHAGIHDNSVCPGAFPRRSDSPRLGHKSRRPCAYETTLGTITPFFVPAASEFPRFNLLCAQRDWKRRPLEPTPICNTCSGVRANQVFAGRSARLSLFQTIYDVFFLVTATALFSSRRTSTYAHLLSCGCSRDCTANIYMYRLSAYGSLLHTTHYVDSVNGIIDASSTGLALEYTTLHFVFSVLTLYLLWYICSCMLLLIDRACTYMLS